MQACKFGHVWCKTCSCFGMYVQLVVFQHVRAACRVLTCVCGLCFDMCLQLVVFDMCVQLVVSWHVRASLLWFVKWFKLAVVNHLRASLVVLGHVFATFAMLLPRGSCSV